MTSLNGNMPAKSAPWATLLTVASLYAASACSGNKPGGYGSGSLFEGDCDTCDANDGCDGFDGCEG